MKGSIVTRKTNGYVRGAREMIVAIATIVVCVIGTPRVFAQAQAPIINDIELRAGERGIILTLFGNGSIRITTDSAELAAKTTPAYPAITMTIPGARSALGAERKFTPPDVLPVREITLRETNSGVVFELKMRGTVGGPVQYRNRDHQVMILLTKSAQPEVQWSASKGLISGPPAPAAQTRQETAAPRNGVERVLNDIRIVERDNSAALYFDFNAPPVASVIRAGDTLKITFANTSLTPKLSAQPYNITGAAFPTVVISRGRGSDGKNAVTAVVRMRQRGATPVTVTDGDKYVIRVDGNVSNQVFLWSAHTGVQSSQRFADIKAEPVDMKKMEARAVRDTHTLSAGQTFPVRDGSAPAPQKQAPVQPPPPAPSSVTPPSAEPQSKVSTPARQQLAVRPETPAARETAVFHDGDSVVSAPESNQVRYRAMGRDPFIPLVRDPNDESDSLPRVENLRLVGVLEDARERIALLEDPTNNNRAYALRVNDPVEYGKVLRVDRNKVVFLIRDFDVSRSYTLNIHRETQSGSTGRRR